MINDMDLTYVLDLVLNLLAEKIDKKKNGSKSEKEEKCIYIRSIHLL